MSHARSDESAPASPLYKAMEEGKTEVVRSLLAQKADTTVRYNGFQPLYVAALKGHLDCIKLLIAHQQQHSIPLNLEDNLGDGSTAFYTAVQNGHTKICQYLLSLGAKIDVEFLGGYTPLYAACQNGHLEVAKILLSNKNKPDINRYFPNGSTAIYIAAQRGHHEMITLLAKHGGNIDQPRIDGGYTPLYVACQKGDLDVVKVLLQCKANPDCVTDRKATPLYVAAQKGHHDIIDLLLKNGANVHAQFENGYTPLHIACAELDFAHAMPVITSLLKAGANPNAYALQGETPAMIASDYKVQQYLSQKPNASHKSSSLAALNVFAKNAKQSHKKQEDDVVYAKIVYENKNPHFSDN
jgi:ankyrin repeat protein